MVPAAGQDQIPMFSTHGGQILLLPRPHWIFGGITLPHNTGAAAPIPCSLSSSKVIRRPMVAKPLLIPLPRRSQQQW